MGMDKWFHLILLWMDILIHVGVKAIPCKYKGPQVYLYALYPPYTSQNKIPIQYKIAAITVYLILQRILQNFFTRFT